MNDLAFRGKDEYQWRLGSPFHKDANLVGRHLERMAEMAGGHITTELIAAEAQMPGSPLYDMFEHDLETAAYAYQREQARAIVNNLVVVTIIPAEKKIFEAFQPTSITIDVTIEDDDDDEQPIFARAFPSIVVNGERSYTPLQTVLRNEDYRNQYMHKLISEAKALARKLRDFKMFGDVVNAIEELPDPASA